MSQQKRRVRGQRVIGAGLGVALVLLISLIGLQSAASSPADALGSSESIQAARPYQAGPLDARSPATAGIDTLSSRGEEGLALVALIAVVLGFRVSGLARSSVSRRRLPPIPS